MKSIKGFIILFSPSGTNNKELVELKNMETTLIIQKLNRILKENNCYKSFYKNFYYNESRKWRTDEDKCGDTIIFQKWVKDVYEQRFNKFSYFYDILSEKTHKKNNNDDYKKTLNNLEN